MSTDTDVDTGRIERYESLESPLESPLVGLERRRTAVAIAYLAVVVALFAGSYAGSTAAIGGATLDTYTYHFDGVSALLIAVATVTMTIGPLLYAAWNGGPALSFAFPLLPVLLGDAAAGRYVLDLDVAIALTVGAAAAALALATTGVRQFESTRPWRAPVDDRSLAVATALIAVAAVGVGRFVAAAPRHALEWYAPFGALWLFTGAVAAAYWYAATRRTVAARRERVNS